MSLFLIASMFVVSALLASFHSHTEEVGVQSQHACSVCILKKDITSPHTPVFLPPPSPILISQSIIIRHSFNLPFIKVSSAVSRAPPVHS